MPALYNLTEEVIWLEDAHILKVEESDISKHDEVHRLISSRAEWVASQWILPDSMMASGRKQIEARCHDFVELETRNRPEGRSGPGAELDNLYGSASADCPPLPHTSRLDMPEANCFDVSLDVRLCVPMLRG